MLRDLLFRMRALIRRDAVEQELDDEIRAHLAHFEQKLIARGMTPVEARRRARIEFGGVEQSKEACRDARGTRLLEDLFQDLRYAARCLRKSPGFTLVAVLSLALGIGANTAIFSVIDALMLRTLPVRNPGELVAFANPGAGNWWGHWAYALFELSRDNDAFSELAATRDVDRYNVALNGRADDAKVRVGLVSGNYFRMLGVGAALGRTFFDEDDKPGARPAAVLSYGYWERRFARDPGMVGRQVALYGTKYDVAGVAAPGFRGDDISQPVDLWIPLAIEALAIPERPGIGDAWEQRGGDVCIVARLKPGVSIRQAQAAEAVVWERFAREQKERLGGRLRRQKARPGAPRAWTRAWPCVMNSRSTVPTMNQA